MLTDWSPGKSSRDATKADYSFTRPDRASRLVSLKGIPCEIKWDACKILGSDLVEVASSDSDLIFTSIFQSQWKRKLNLSLYTPRINRAECRLCLHSFLIAALQGGECTASSSGYFTHGVRTTGTSWIGGWVSPSALWCEKAGSSYNIVPVFIHRWEYQLSSRIPMGHQHNIFPGRPNKKAS